MLIRLSLAILLGATVVGCGDDDNDGIECILDSHCDRRPDGDCVVAPSGKQWCAYPDTEGTCDSGLRYDERDVGDNLAGMCVVYEFDAGVPDAGVDAGVPDAGVLDAGVDAMTPDAMVFDAMPPPPIVQIAAGGGHTCVVLGTGKVRCWGIGSAGRLGYGNTEDIGDNETPFSAGDVSIGTLANEIGAGTDHTCARVGTNVRCWGENAFGQLGYGNTTDIGDNETPASVANVMIGGNVTQVVAGESYTCALLSGNVRCWGANEAGQLGYGNTNQIGDNETPLTAGDVPVGGTVTQISVGGGRTCVVLDTQNIRCWGRDTLDNGLGYGPGIGNIGDNESPSDVGNINVGALVKQVAVGNWHICILLTTNRVRCWGESNWGQLGYGSTNKLNVIPNTLSEVDLGGDVEQIAAGRNHTCALMQGGSVRCWGNGASGQLGYGNTNNIGDDEVPSAAGDVVVGGIVVEITAGSFHTCARLQDGNVRCWGLGSSGVLGYGNTDSIGDNETPNSAGNVPVL